MEGASCVVLACDWSIKPVLMYQSSSYQGTGILQLKRSIWSQTYWTRRLQPIHCLSAFQYHERKIASYPETDKYEK
uniref:RT_RNaseH_2 domain-containing protein n=1 Tax=Mesocestoides corti TaxID=53468 RepID=A0A5K3ERJ3_MESCO